MKGDSVPAAILAGDLRAGALLMRALDDERPGAIEDLRSLYRHTGKAQIIGITGNPGAGKSTLVDALIVHYRRAGARVGVVAVDPTSPFTGGAILADRIRMQQHALDPGVFIRSLATRGQMGGLSRSTIDVVDVLDAMGFEVILVETVGVGQDEVDVVGITDTAVVVTLPGLGDEVQALKAGLLEIADVLVVNKADREGADGAVRDLTTMLNLRAGGRGDLEILKTVASKGEGVDDVVTAVDRHQQRQKASGGWQRRRLARATAQIRAILFERLRQAAEARVSAAGGFEALAALVASRDRDPYSVADGLIKVP